MKDADEHELEVIKIDKKLEEVKNSYIGVEQGA